jgi:hypothetical protein
MAISYRVVFLVVIILFLYFMFLPPYLVAVGFDSLRLNYITVVRQFFDKRTFGCYLLACDHVLIPALYFYTGAVYLRQIWKPGFFV